MKKKIIIMIIILIMMMMMMTTTLHHALHPQADTVTGFTLKDQRVVED